MRILVFCDDLYHPAATVRAGLALLSAEHGFAFDWVEDASAWDSESLKNYPVALLSKSNVLAHGNNTPWLKRGTEELFLNYVRSGRGLLVVHSGNASYADIAPMRTMIGGAFLSHPPECEVVVEPRPGHPMTAGVDGPFTIWDEHYVMALDDSAADLFLQTRSVHGVQPAGWTRTDGLGRVCVLTPGHNLTVWLHPSFQRLLSNALSSLLPIQRTRGTEAHNSE